MCSVTPYKHWTHPESGAVVASDCRAIDIFTADKGVGAAQTIAHIKETLFAAPLRAQGVRDMWWEK